MAMNAKNSIVSVVDAPKRKPFPTKKQTVNTDAGEWTVKDVNGKVVLVEAYPEAVEVPKVQDGAKKKPFPTKKQTVSADAGEWIVKEVDGKRVFVAV
jgi:hypothetical protein